MIMAFGIIAINIMGAIVMLCFTSYLDLKTREVEDKVWIIFGVCAALLQGYEVFTGLTDLLTLGISVLVSALLGLGLYYFGFYGGADGKALIVLAIFLPVYKPRVGLYQIAPLIVLTNGVLISMILPVSLLVLNSIRLLRGERIFEGFDEPKYRKLLAAMLGYKPFGKPRPFQFSLEKPATAEEENQRGSKKFDFSLMRDDFEEKPNTWVTPGIPLLVFFTAGFVVLLFYGDLVIGMIEFLAKVL
jgi:preflagellin peptidase FlaK